MRTKQQVTDAKKRQAANTAKKKPDLQAKYQKAHAKMFPTTTLTSGMTSSGQPMNYEQFRKNTKGTIIIK